MENRLLHTCSNPSADVKIAAEETMNVIRAYMAANPTSELHTCGKMFGVLMVDYQGETHYLRAFSAMLDGCYLHDGFVPPIYIPQQMPVGHNREESQRLQKLLFAHYNILNTHGETRNLLDIFASEKPIISPEEWFSGSPKKQPRTNLPPSGTGECCAPKLLQYALKNGLKPIGLAEFWMGASPKNELRREGCFYPPCSGKCQPILKWVLGDEKLPIVGCALSYSAQNEADIIYEDDWLMVVNKPAGLLSVPGRSDEPSLVEQLKAKNNYTFLQPAHRLDQDTSGLLVLAKTPDVYKTLQAYFQRRDILKRYEAVIECNAAIPTEGDISLPLLPNPLDRPRQMVDFEHGKIAQTTYRVREKRNNGTIFIDMFPRTGRTHQLRVHAAHPMGLNAPIVGDRLYGTPAKRLMLHAAEIRFIHPITKEEMHFCIPSDF